MGAIYGWAFACLHCLSHVQPCATPWTIACRLFCPWNFPGKNTGVSCHFLLQRISQTQGWNPCLLCLLHWQAGPLPLVSPGKLLYINSSPLLSASCHQKYLLINLHPLGKVKNYLFLHLIILFSNNPSAILQRKKVGRTFYLLPTLFYFFTIPQKVINIEFSDLMNQENWAHLEQLRESDHFLSKFPSIALLPRHSSLLK